jgi:hypothetical protein
VRGTQNGPPAVYTFFEMVRYVDTPSWAPP